MVGAWLTSAGTLAVAVDGGASVAVDILTPALTGINVLLLVFALTLELVAFVHCAVQRRDAFEAVGTLPKGLWLLLLGGGALLTVLVGTLMIFFMLIGIIAAAVYLLDVRPGIRDLADGSGPW